MKNFYGQNRLTVLLIILSCLLPMLLLGTPAYALESLLLIRADGKGFEQAVQGLKEELEEEFSISEMLATPDTSAEQLAQEMQRVSPQILVLMDNIAITLCKSYQKGLPESAPIVPSVCLMASFMDIAIQGMRNATGIFYEVPLVTSVVNLRVISPSVPLNKVGVVYRAFMEPSVTINHQYCQKEGIDLVSYQVSNEENIRSELRKGLKNLKQEGIEALWIPNDNQLVNVNLLKSVWLPFAKKFKKPIIAGADVLVEPKLKFGTFAVIPDHLRLGAQAADIVFDVMENAWQVGDQEIEPPRSVYKTINFKQAKRLLKVDEDDLTNIDKILK